MPLRSSDLVPVGSVNEVLVPASVEAPVQITAFSSTVYYKTTSGVTSSSNDGNLTAGQKLYSSVNQYIIASANVLVQVVQAPSTVFPPDVNFFRSGTAAATLTGALTVTGTSTFTGAATPTGGVTRTNGTVSVPPKFWSANMVPATATTGTDAAAQNNKLFISEIFVPANLTLTGIQILNGSAAATDKYVGVIYDDTGAIVANGAVAGVTASGTAAMQSIAFTGTGSLNPVTLKGPAKYFVGVQLNGTTAKFRAHAFGAHSTGLITVTWGTVDATITPPTTFTADVGPYICVY